LKKLSLAFALAALSASAASADVVADRQAIMKAAGKAVGSIVPIAKGEAPFDAAAVAAAFAAINENAQKIDVAALFPEGSETGESTASPKIWEDIAGFHAAVDKYKADTAAAVAANSADLAAFQAQFGAVTKNCGSCHEVYRIKKD
jgi:cytochrome c556